MLVRWLLLLLISLDLVTSPFHHHSHDVGGDSAMESSVHAGESVLQEYSLHVEADSPALAGHSLALLTPKAPEVDPAKHLAQHDLVPVPVSDQQDFSREATSLAYLSEGSSILSVKRYSRPTGRAPPTLLS